MVFKGSKFCLFFYLFFKESGIFLEGKSKYCERKKKKGIKVQRVVCLLVFIFSDLCFSVPLFSVPLFLCSLFCNEIS